MYIIFILVGRNVIELLVESHNPSKAVQCLYDELFVFISFSMMFLSSGSITPISCHMAIEGRALCLSLHPLSHLARFIHHVLNETITIVASSSTTISLNKFSTSTLKLNLNGLLHSSYWDKSIACSARYYVKFLAPLGIGDRSDKPLIGFDRFSYDEMLRLFHVPKRNRIRK